MKAGGDKFPILGYIGPLLIIFLGVYLLIRSLKETRHENEEECKNSLQCVQKKRTTYFQTAITPFKIDEITKAGRAQKRAGADLSNKY